MPAPRDPNHLGTLVCVVMKARNLPNKRSIGKQDPYCSLTYNGETQRTHPDKKGGQHPEWDAQLHFEVYTDMEDHLLRNSSAANTAGSLSSATAASASSSRLSSATIGSSATVGSSSTAAKKRATAPKILKVACYADDAREPDFIGEGYVDLATTLKKGEFDDWVTIKTAKDRYAGEVYLELTFYSARQPPKKKSQPQPVLEANDTYGGAGTFTDDIGSYHEDADTTMPPRPPAKGHRGEIPASMRTGAAANGQPRRAQNASGLTSSRSHAQFGSSESSSRSEVPAVLRPSSNLAHVNEYNPPYAPARLHRAPSPLPPGAGGSATGPAHPVERRRDSLPAPRETMPSHVSTPSLASYQSGSLGPSASYRHQAWPSSASNATVRQSWAAPNDSSAADELARSMSSMSFRSSVHVDKPLPPPTPLQEAHGQPPQPYYPAPQGAHYPYTTYGALQAGTGTGSYQVTPAQAPPHQYAMQQGIYPPPTPQPPGVVASVPPPPQPQQQQHQQPHYMAHAVPPPPPPSVPPPPSQVWYPPPPATSQQMPPPPPPSQQPPAGYSPYYAQQAPHQPSSSPPMNGQHLQQPHQPLEPARSASPASASLHRMTPSPGYHPGGYNAPSHPHALPSTPVDDVTPTPSVVNAQSHYRPLPSTPPRAASPAPSAAPSVTSSQVSYAPPPPPQSFFQTQQPPKTSNQASGSPPAHPAPRPLPPPGDAGQEPANSHYPPNSTYQGSLAPSPSATPVSGGWHTTGLPPSSSTPNALVYGHAPPAAPSTPSPYGTQYPPMPPEQQQHHHYPPAPADASVNGGGGGGGGVHYLSQQLLGHGGGHAHDGSHGGGHPHHATSASTHSHSGQPSPAGSFVVALPGGYPPSGFYAPPAHQQQQQQQQQQQPQY